MLALVIKVCVWTPEHGCVVTGAKDFGECEFL